MEGCSSCVFPDELQDQPFECYIASAASGPFKTSYLSARTGEIVSFGKYLKFVITPKTSPANVSSGVQQPRDAFHLMVSVQLTKHVPSKVTEHNSKDWMKNRLIESLEQRSLAGALTVFKPLGESFLA